MQQLLDDDATLQSWFGCFATRLDPHAEQHMPLPLENDECGDLKAFIDELRQSRRLLRDATCRLAYNDKQGSRGRELQLFINGCEWDTDGVSSELLQWVANHRLLEVSVLAPFLAEEDNQVFLYELWKLQWLQMVD